MADSFTAALVDRLLADPGVAGLVGDRIHWGIVPQGTPLPYVRLQVVSDPRPQHLKGYEGARTSRVQSDSFAATYAASRAIAEAQVAALTEPADHGGVRFGGIAAQGPRDLGEDGDDGFIHRASIDLLVRHTLL